MSKKEYEKQMSKMKISKLGKAMSSFPVAPRFGKMLALSHQVNLKLASLNPGKSTF